MLQCNYTLNPGYWKGSVAQVVFKPTTLLYHLGYIAMVGTEWITFDSIREVGMNGKCHGLESHLSHWILSVAGIYSVALIFIYEQHFGI